MLKKEVNKENLLFKVIWENGNQCVSDLISAYCKKNDIKERWNHYFQHEILLNGEWIVTDYVSEGSNNIVNIILKK